MPCGSIAVKKNWRPHEPVSRRITLRVSDTVYANSYIYPRNTSKRPYPPTYVMKLSQTSARLCWISITHITIKVVAKVYPCRASAGPFV
eukprot:scaffold315598_cov37-Prasinocladus_malaysianus.AAC.2